MNHRQLRGKLWAAVITIACFGSVPHMAHAGSGVVYNVIVRSEPGCPSGIGFEIPDWMWRCVLPDKKVDLHPYVGQTIKVLLEFKHLTFKLVQLNPDAAVGSEKNGVLSKLGSATVAAGQVLVAANGGTVSQDTTSPEAGTTASAQPAQDQPTPQPQSGQPVAYVTGVNECASGFWENSAGTTFYTFRNSCAQKINLRFLNRNGGGGSMDLEPGSKQSTGDPEYLMQKNGNYETYACPYHYVAVDPYGNWFTRPVASYTCKPAGY